MAEQASQVEGAEPPPPGQIADIDHPQDALYSISVAIAVLTLILPIPFLLMRMYTTWKLSSRLKVDDWSSAAAFLFGFAYLASGIVFAEHGGGHHVWEVTDSQLQGILETTYWNSIVYSPAACLIKITLLLIAVRVFRSNRLFVYLGYSLMTVMVGYYVPETVLKIMTCRPIEGYWDYGEDSSCYEYRSVFLSDAIGAVITDMLVLLVAMPFAWMQGRVGVKTWLIVGAGSVSDELLRISGILEDNSEMRKSPCLLCMDDLYLC